MSKPGKDHYEAMLYEMSAAAIRRLGFGVCALHEHPQEVSSCQCMEPRYPPCTRCGDRCESQMEFMYLNGDKPWANCSACDPTLEEG